MKNVRSYFLVVIFFPFTTFVDVDVDLKFPKEEKKWKLWKYHAIDPYKANDSLVQHKEIYSITSPL